MEKLAICLLGLGVFLLSVQNCMLNHKVTNLERQQLRIEQEYQRVITQNEQLKRINDQNLRLMTEGGWYGDTSLFTDN